MVGGVSGLWLLVVDGMCSGNGSSCWIRGGAEVDMVVSGCVYEVDEGVKNRSGVGSLSRIVVL